jgi:carbonic anhydrase
MQKTYLALISFGCIVQEFVQAQGSTVVDYKTNGANWGDDYPLCKYGKEQTPINLTTKGYSTSPNMQLNGYAYQNMPRANVLRSANSINLNLSGGEFEIAFPDGSKSLFSPLQFHFHAPSEHSVDGKLYDLELHIVHTYKD